MVVQLLASSFLLVSLGPSIGNAASLDPLLFPLTVGIVQYSKRYVYYGKKSTTGTVGIVRYSKSQSKYSKIQYVKNEVKE